MLFELSGLVGDRALVRRRVGAEQFAVEPDAFQIADDVELDLDLRRSGQSVAVAVTGQVKTRLALTCSRCLEPFQLPVAVDVDLEYRPQSENRGEEEVEVDETDLRTAFYRDDAIDLGDLVREQCYLALPMKPLCQEGCRGLCPTCGRNLNDGECDCRAEWEDPRLAVLKSLLKDKSRHQ